MLGAAGPLPESIPRKKPLREMGVDSFMAVRLRHALQDASGERLPASLLFNYSTIEALAEHLTVRWASARPAMASLRGSEIVARLKDMSEDEAQTFLAAVKS
ncbi:acyl carrier protein [Pendulispora brunnea]|uniref:Acyl carrier protein n=2 Tax=Pendulispora brunnea TaxID=2905690 RepID=A0ABZ2KSS2_9BACT